MTTLFQETIEGLTAQLCTLIEQTPMPEQIEVLNQVRRALHTVSPFKDEPVDCVLWVAADTVQPNDYNPNAVAPPEMKLLEHSIKMDGYTQPIVGFDTGDKITVVDGEHRSRVGKNVRAVRDRVHQHLPVVVINDARHDAKDRMAATIRHNRARGVHGVTPMSTIMADLIRAGWNDVEIAKELGMDADEVLRFKQFTGLPELFKDHTFGQAWE